MRSINLACGLLSLCTLVAVMVMCVLLLQPQQDPYPVDVYTSEYMIDGNQMAIVGENSASLNSYDSASHGVSLC